MRKEVDEKGLTEEEFLRGYKPGDYDRPSVTVDMVLFGTDEVYSSLKVLLIKRKNHPYINRWAFPGGFVNIDESSYMAAKRELLEETGLKDVYMEQLYTFTDPMRDPRMRVIDIAYLALLQECPVTAGDDAKLAAWFNVGIEEDLLILENTNLKVRIEYSLSKKFYKNGVLETEGFDKPKLISDEGLAFDHAQILLEGLLRIRNKAEYTDIVFNLMPECFTLTDLMRAYEIVLGKSLYRKNFRDKMKNKTIPTGEMGYSRSTNGQTPSELYKYKTGG